MGVNDQMAKFLAEGLGNVAIKLFTAGLDGARAGMLPKTAPGSRDFPAWYPRFLVEHLQLLVEGSQLPGADMQLRDEGSRLLGADSRFPVEHLQLLVEGSQLPGADMRLRDEGSRLRGLKTDQNGIFRSIWREQTQVCRK